MKNILLISSFYSEYISAGTSQRTKDIKKGLSNLGWNCKVVTIKRSKYPIEKEPDKEIMKPIAAALPIALLIG